MKNTLILATLALAASIPAAYAQTTYDWNERGSSYGDASGTLTINDTPITPYGGGNEYAITTITGGFTSGPLGGSSVALSAFDVAVLSGSLASPTLLGGVFLMQVQSAGLYLIGGGIGISGGTPSTPYFVSTYPTSPGGIDGQNDSFTLNPAGATAVPESPVNPGLLAGAGMFIAWRSWRSVRVARA